MSSDQADWVIGLPAFIALPLLPVAMIAWYNIGDYLAAERIRRRTEMPG